MCVLPCPPLAIKSGLKAMGESPKFRLDITKQPQTHKVFFSPAFVTDLFSSLHLLSKHVTLALAND